MAAVQVIAAQAVGASDGQAAAGDHLHDSPHLCLRVTHKLEGRDSTWLSVWVKHAVKAKQQCCLSIILGLQSWWMCQYGFRNSKREKREKQFLVLNHCGSVHGGVGSRL